MKRMKNQKRKFAVFYSVTILFKFYFLSIFFALKDCGIISVFYNVYTQAGCMCTYLEVCKRVN